MNIWYRKALLGLALGVLLSVSALAAQQSGKVTGNYVNLRAEPSSSAAIIGGVSKDETVTVLEDLGSGWLSVSFRGMNAYMSSAYVEILPESAVKQNPKGVVTVDNANVRAGPSVNDARLTTASKGAEVEILAEENGWYKVRLEFQVGYIRADLIQITWRPEEPAPAVPEPPPAKETSAVVTGTVVNVRSGAGTSFSIIGKVARGDKVTILQSLDGWVQIRFGSLTGFASTEYVTPENQTTEPPPATESGLVTGSYVNVRKAASTASESLGTLPRGSQVEILSAESGWLMIRIGDLTGYMSAEYIAIGAIAYTPPATFPLNPDANSVGRISDQSGSHAANAREALVNFAKTLLGVPYIYAGNSPQTGFDCSGFTQYVFNSLGYELPRLAQYNAGRAISKSELLPGDLVFFGPGGNINHVGIYIGYDQFIHAPNSGRPVSIDTLSAGYYLTNYVRATRLLP